MDKTAPAPPPIANVADYIDALTRPPSQEPQTSKKAFPSRRMRDKFREEVAVVAIAGKPA